MFDLSSIMQPAITAGVAVIGWWVKGIRADFKELSANLEAMRAELHQEMQQYTRTDTCEAHRRSIQAQIDILRREQERFFILRSPPSVLYMNYIDSC